MTGVQTCALPISEIVNQDPYNEGWLVKMKVQNPAAIHALLDAEAYRQLTGE